MEREMQAIDRYGEARQALRKVAAACLLAASIAGCAGGEAKLRADRTDPQSDHSTDAGLTSRVGFGAAMISPSVVRPVKEPVSTLHRAVMLTGEFIGGLITVPLEAIASGGSPPEYAPAAGGGMDLVAWEKTLDELTGTGHRRTPDQWRGVLSEAVRRHRTCRKFNRCSALYLRYGRCGAGHRRPLETPRRARFAAFERAQRYVFVQTPYLADDDAVDRLASAARRGIDVRVILPEVNDSALMAESNRTSARILLDAGVRVYIYPGFTHAKAMLADDWAISGSSNMDWLSHAVNYEMDIATPDSDITGRLKRDLFMVDFRLARELQPPEAPEPIRRLASVGSPQWW